MLYTARVWISSSHVAAVAAKGFHIVHAASDSFYLVRVSVLSNHLSDLTNPFVRLGWNRIAAAAAGWETSPQATAGVIP